MGRGAEEQSIFSFPAWLLGNENLSALLSWQSSSRVTGAPVGAGETRQERPAGGGAFSMCFKQHFLSVSTLQVIIDRALGLLIPNPVFLVSIVTGTHK
jgi:hypothetical protein